MLIKLLIVKINPKIRQDDGNLQAENLRRTFRLLFVDFCFPKIN